MTFSIPENTVVTIIDVVQPCAHTTTKDTVHKETGQLQAQRTLQTRPLGIVTEDVSPCFLELVYPHDPGEKGQSPVVCVFPYPGSQHREQRLQQVSV